MSRLKLLFPALTAVLILTGCHGTDNTDTGRVIRKDHSLADELKIFHDIGSLPAYMDGTRCAQVSSYDTTWGNDDGFSGRFSFLKRNKDSSLVIFDARSGGVINRIWTPTPTMDTLDFYLDDDNKPAFSICFMDLFSGKKFPFVAPLCGNQLGGYYCYTPVLFRKSCRIITRGKKMQFYQIQYRLYEKEAVINPEQDTEAKQELLKIAALWSKKERSVHDFYTGNLSVSSKTLEIKPGETATLFRSDKGGRILGIEISPADVFEGLIKDTDIKINWDGENTPAVYCPVADFFGYAFGTPSMQSLLLGSSSGTDYCYFPMPFDKSATIELIRSNSKHSSGVPLKIKTEIWYTDNKRSPGTEGKFYTQWRKTLKSLPGQPHILADIKGRGQYVGTLLQAQGLKAGMTIFFEGDDSTSIDGVFRMHGTGSEDYFNGGWYAMMDRWDDRMSLPLHGSLGYSLPFCRTGGYRLFLSDKISFEKTLFHSIEHGPVKNNFPVDYTSLGLYYSDSPPDNITYPAEELSRVFIPDTLVIYPQLIDYNLYGDMDVKTTWKYGTGGESYLFTPGADSWLRISLREIPSGNYSLFFDIEKEPAGCDFSLWQRQKQVSDWLSSYNVTEERTGELYVCDISVPESNKTITVRFRKEGQKNSLLLNRITLIRKKTMNQI